MKIIKSEKHKLYFQFKTEEEMNKIVTSLESAGYNLSFSVKDISFDYIKGLYKRNKIYLVKPYYNITDTNYEYTFATRQMEAKNGYN